MTVVQNVEYVLRLNGSQRRRREAAREFLEAVGMSWASDLWPSRLSRGQAQRVALARCLATGSEVVLLDEPFASLDAITRKKMRGFLLDLAVARSLAYVLVTHDAQEAIELTDRILVLTARPARIIADFARRDGSFGANIEERIWELLR
jgi:NitT/TauT family transport system ATP-binding protein